MAIATKAMQAEGTYGIKSWDEKTWDGVDHKEAQGAKLTHADVVFTFQSGFEGEARAQSLMTYRDDGSAVYVGLQEMTGRLGDKSGSFVMDVQGAYENGAATSSWTVIPGTGTGDFTNLRGEGRTVAHHGDTQPFTLDYYFE